MGLYVKNIICKNLNFFFFFLFKESKLHHFTLERFDRIVDQIVHRKTGDRNSNTIYR